MASKRKEREKRENEPVAGEFVEVADRVDGDVTLDVHRLLDGVLHSGGAVSEQH
jgi:hypothetical protein